MIRRSLAGLGLAVCCAAQAELAGDYTDTFTYEIREAVAQPTLAVSPRADIAFAWAETSSDGSLEIRLATGRGATGTQQQANTTTAGQQEAPSVAIDATGDIVLVWRGPEGIYGRRFSVDGEARGGEFQVSLSPWDERARVAVDAFGNFVVAWSRFDRDAWSWQILARRYLADGTPLDAEFQVDGPAAGEVGNPAVAMGAWGEFVIAWEQANGTQPDVFVRSFAADGTPDGAESLAGALPAEARTAPAVGMDAHGRFVVAWSNKDLSGAQAIHARQYLAGGSPVGSEFTVNVDSPSLWLQGPAVGMGALGDFVVAWASDYSEWGKQQFAPDGARVGPPDFQRTRLVPIPAAATDADGDAFVGHINEYNGSPEIVRYAGREPVDAVLTVTDLADPIFAGESVRYQFTVTNQHPGRVETGIPEIDSAIGLIDSGFIASTLRGDGLVKQATADCPPEDFFFAAWVCPISRLFPGESVTRVVEASAMTPGQVVNQAHVYHTQHEPDWPNNEIAEPTLVQCTDGRQPGTVRIVAAPSSIDESQWFDIQLERTGGTCGAVTASWAFGPSEVWPYRGELRWADGQDGVLTDTLNVDDETHEEGETIEFVLSVSGGAVLGDPSRVTINVIDDDLPCEGGGGTFVISGPTSVEEGESAAITIDRVGGNCGFASVQYVTDSGPDNPRSAGYFSWQSGEDDARLVVVGTTEDNIDEDNQPFGFYLKAPGTTRTIASRVITIVDDDATPTVSILPGPRTVTEGEGSFVDFVVALSHPTEKAVRVPFTLGGSAARGSDYSATPVDPLNLTQSPQGTIRIQYFDDDIDEKKETVLVTLGESPNVILGIGEAELTLRDNDEPPTLTLQNDYTMDEGGTHQLLLTLSNRSVWDVQVPLTIVGTATAADLVFPASVTVPAGQTSLAIPVTAVTDGLDEDDEVAVVRLGSPEHAVLGTDVESTLTLVDIDPKPTLSFQSTGQVTREGAGVEILVTVELSAVSGRQVSVALPPSGSAKRGTDWDMAGDTIVIPAGSRTAAKVVTLVNDIMIELDEEVTFWFRSLTNATAAGTLSHTVTIRDNDPELLGVREKVEGQ